MGPETSPPARRDVSDRCRARGPRLARSCALLVHGPGSDLFRRVLGSPLLSESFLDVFVLALPLLAHRLPRHPGSSHGLSGSSSSYYPCLRPRTRRSRCVWGGWFSGIRRPANRGKERPLRKRTSPRERGGGTRCNWPSNSTPAPFERSHPRTGRRSLASMKVACAERPDAEPSFPCTTTGTAVGRIGRWSGSRPSGTTGDSAVPERSSVDRLRLARRSIACV